jgi:hypothetical protein
LVKQAFALGLAAMEIEETLAFRRACFILPLKTLETFGASGK